MEEEEQRPDMKSHSSVAVRAAPPKLAVIVTGDEAPIVGVGIVNVALVCFVWDGCRHLCHQGRRR